MFKNDYGIALKQWVDARKRADASEERIGRTFVDWFFRRDTKNARPTSRPCINVTPPKPPKK